MEYLVGIVILVIIGFIFFVTSLAKMAERGRAKEQELEEWDGILDVKRKARDKLKSDVDYVNSVQDHFNDK